MQIAGQNILMQAKHNKFVSHTKEESLKYWIGERPGEENNSGNLTARLSEDALSISEEARKLWEERKAKNQKACASGETEEVTLSEKDKQTIELLEVFIEQLTGKKVNIQIADAADILNKRAQAENGQPIEEVPSDEPAEPNWGLEYEYHESYYETEQMSYTAAGVIKTADGKEINFSVDLKMSRSYYSQTDVSLRAGNAKAIDPLVINYNGTAPDLTDLKFAFDLDADGNEDQISFLKPGSGFLALDQNEDGTINDGTELFGPTSGNGFTELAAHDEDHNGWIDDNDPIFNRLRVWSKDGQGNDRLLALGEVGVGAIYLGHIDTPYELKDSDNQLDGVVRRTGVYVNDNEQVGTVQQIDLTV